MIIIGVIGIWKNKLPKYSDGLGFASEVKFYILFYVLVILGVIFLIIEFKQGI